MELRERISFLQHTPIFEDTAEPVLSKLASSLEEMQVEEGTNIVLKGETGDAMYIIIDGKVKIHDGDHIFSFMKSGDVFGKYYLIDHKERSASVSAVMTSRLFRLPQRVFDEITSFDSSLSRGMLKTLVRRLREMNRIEEQLAEMNATKDKFFSIIAHDLRGPISTLISLSELLKDERDEMSREQVTEILKSQHDISWHSLKLLDNLLQWARLQTGRLIPNHVSFDITALIREVEEFCLASANAKTITIKKLISNRLFVFADREMIRIVLLNLLSNAIKFTRPGGNIVISSTLDGARVFISIKDNGVGMTPEFISNLFRPDQSNSTRGTAHEKGTGLGLILCKEFIEKNGGAIKVVSSPETGSCFTIILPEGTPD